LRGTTADVLVIDEGAYVDLRLFYEVIIPLLENARTVMLIISTPTNSFNFFSRLMQLKDKSGRPLFLVLSADLVCQRCKKTEHPENCRHLVYLLPRWKSEDKMDLAQMIMQDETTTLLRESRGLIIDHAQAYLKPDEIDRFLLLPLFVFIDNPRYVLVAIDPNARAGKSSSNMALFAMTLEGGIYTVSIFFLHKNRRSNSVKHDNLLQIFAHYIACATQKIIRFDVQQFQPIIKCF